MKNNRLMSGILLIAFFTLATCVSAMGGEIKIALDTPRNLEVSGTYVWAKTFSDYLTEKGMNPKMYDRDALGGEEEKLDQVCQGLLEISCSDVAKAGQLSPSVFGFYMPFMFDSMMHLDKVVSNTKLLANINKDLGKRGARILALVPLGGFVGIINTKKTIKTPSDMKGLRFRALDNKQAAWLNAWGANSVIIPWPEIYNSLQTGVVDGYLNVSIVPVMFKHTEVVKYFSDVGLAAPLRIILCSQKWYAGLNNTEKSTVDQAVVKANAANRTWQSKNEIAGLAALKKGGVEVYKNSPEEIAMFAGLVKSQYNEMMDSVIVKQFVTAADANR
jgi:TRAP-type transport system periplasmic protein